MNRITLVNRKEDKEMDLSTLRQSYTRDGLLEKDLPDHPAELLKAWFEEAINGQVTEPNAMALATVQPDGTPDVRTVLLKEIEERAVTFYTSYNSEKARHLDHCPYAACSLWWSELERQIRLRGAVEKVSREESNAYFSTRPRESQIGAWASRQSDDLQSRNELEQRFAEYEEKFRGEEVPLPDHWGGFRIDLEELEFWQGRPGRLHDRILYRKERSTDWQRKRLSP